MDVREEAVQKKLELGGFLTTGTKYPLKNAHDLSVAYTPGVAEPCLRIKEKEELSFDLTCRGNMVAVISDGTRVLGLGDIGAAAAMPVMEGKSLLFKRFGNVDCVPVVIDTKDAEEFIHTVKLLQKNYAGINLEDISSPKCYEIENRLKEELEIPVFHDDQHGTAIACLAGVKAALRFVKKDLSKVKIVVNGAGAAGANIARLLYLAGARDITLMVSSGVLTKSYKRLDSLQAELIDLLGQEGKSGNLAEIAKGADVLLGVSAAGAFTEDILKNLAKDKLDKIGEDGVKKEMMEKGISETAITKMQPLFSFTGTFSEKINQLSDLLADSEEGMKGVEELRFICDKVPVLVLGCVR